MTDKGRKRIRKSPEERKREIIKAAVNLVGEKGYYGTSLKEIADEVGMSQPGMLHYIGNKENLLSMLVTDSYDAEGTPDDFIRSGLPGSDRGDLRFPAYLRFLVRYNAQRRSLLQLYIVLESESFSPEHPLHEYFENRPDLVWGALLPIPVEPAARGRGMGEHASDRAPMRGGHGWHPAALDPQTAHRPV